MSMSGMAVYNSFDEYQQELQKGSGECAFWVLDIVDVDGESQGTKKAQHVKAVQKILKSDPITYEEFAAEYLMQTRCYYLLINNLDGGKPGLISWIPENAPVKKKMVFASTLQTVQTAFKIGKTIQATENDDIEILKENYDLTKLNSRDVK